MQHKRPVIRRSPLSGRADVSHLTDIFGLTWPKTPLSCLLRPDFQAVRAKVLLWPEPRYLRDQAQYAEAEPLYKQAMEIWRTALGERHPSYAASLNNLVELYRAMGRHAEAEPLYKQAMEIRRTALGERHPDYATSLNNLAVLYYAMGRHAEAEELRKKAMAIHRRPEGDGLQPGQ